MPIQIPKNDRNPGDDHEDGANVVRALQPPTGSTTPKAGLRTPSDRERERTARREKDRLLLHQTAYHEASHAVVHFAVENPHSPRLHVSSMGGSYTVYSCHGTPHVWMALAGYLGSSVHAIEQHDPVGKFSQRWDHIRFRLHEGGDHIAAAANLFPDYSQEKSVTRGRIGTALRQEARLVWELLRTNWHVVERVAETALLAGTLGDYTLRPLIEGHNDLVHVWDSDVAEQFRESDQECSQRWVEAWR